MGSFGPIHWIIVAIIVMLVFGGRIKLSAVMGDAAQGLRAFREGLKNEAPRRRGTWCGLHRSPERKKLRKPAETLAGNKPPCWRVLLEVTAPIGAVIKLTAMPAWGRTHSNAEVWDLVAFLWKMPDFAKGRYGAAVQSASAAPVN